MVHILSAEQRRVDEQKDFFAPCRNLTSAKVWKVLHVNSLPARELSECMLHDALPRRWSHVSAVAARAEQVAAAPGVDGDALVAAAWLHDIGYAPSLALTGFHPLDGARYLANQDVSPRVVSLVAYHSCAWLEAGERGLLDELRSEFAREDSPTADALCYCDMTTGPDGIHVNARDRLDEIRSRYGPDDVVTRFIDRAEPEILAAVDRTERALSTVGVVL